MILKKILMVIAALVAMAAAAPAQASNVESYVARSIAITCEGDGAKTAARGMAYPGSVPAHRGVSCATEARMDAVSNVYWQVYQRVLAMPEIRAKTADGSPTPQARALRRYASENYCASTANESVVLTQVIDYRAAANITRRFAIC